MPNHAINSDLGDAARPSAGYGERCADVLGGATGSGERAYDALGDFRLGSVLRASARHSGRGRVPFLLTDWRVERPLLGLTTVRLAGAAMVLAGVASLLVSFARFAIKGTGMPAPVAPPTRLVASGQYRHVRNPMYVAVLAIVLGQSLALGSIRLLGDAAVLWLLFLDWVVWYEEPKLGTQFGQFYRTYQESVRRWWPRIRPWNAQHSTMAR